MNLLKTFLVLCPLFLLLTGFLLRNHHSEYSDRTCGYHVGRIAKKSEPAWEEANRYCGTLFLRSGGVVLLLNGAVIFFLQRWVKGPVEKNAAIVSDGMFYLMFSLLLPILLAILLTERHLKKRFHKDGSPKQPPEK